MAIWKDLTAVQKDGVKEPVAELPSHGIKEKPAAAPVSQDFAPRGRSRGEPGESVIAADITIEGKIEGSGHVRIAGRFNGDVNVDGNLTVDAGAKLTGAVRAKTVTIGGELEGNIESASAVELLQTGVLSGDLTAGSLTVAAGSRMRGRVEFGWEGKGNDRIASRKEGGSAA